MEKTKFLCLSYIKLLCSSIKSETKLKFFEESYLISKCMLIILPPL